MHPESLETKRLILRKFTLSDAQDVLNLNADPMVTKYLPHEDWTSLSKAIQNIESKVLKDYETYGFGRMAVFLKDSNEFMGFSGLKVEEDVEGVDLGFRFRKKFWNQGYGYESALPFIKIGFEDLKLNEILGGAMPDNLGSVAILKKVGMTYRRDLDIDGVLFNVFSITKDEYANSIL